MTRVMFALDHRKELPGAWGWMLASGIVDLATIILAGLLGTAAWAIGLLVGINLTFGSTVAFGRSRAWLQALPFSGALGA